VPESNGLSDRGNAVTKQREFRHLVVFGSLPFFTAALLLTGCGDQSRSAVPAQDAPSSGSVQQALADEALLNAGGPGDQLASDVNGVLSSLSLDVQQLIPLSAAPVPRPPRTDIKNQAAAVRLGKALFWDIQLGGDGQTACASCHFKGGVDNRLLNSINPGPNGRWDAVSGPGQLFSFQHLDDTDPTDASPPTEDDILGSQGVPRMVFKSLNPDPLVAADICVADSSGLFAVHRQVTGRNAPSTVAAVFNRQQFWDGRANDKFNGLNPFGNTGNAAPPKAVTSLAPLPIAGPEAFRPDGNLAYIDTGVTEDLVPSSSLASQAVGPVNNDVEMSCAGRKMNGRNGLAAKMLERRPLRLQSIDSTDSVLGALADPLGGLRVTYRQLVKAAFNDALLLRSQDRFTSVLGQAIQAYETTLIPSQTKFDSYLAGDITALSDQQKAGLAVFQGRGNCMSCHAGTELTDASARYFAQHGPLNSDGGDQGFHNIGVRPTENDLGRAGVGPAGVSFSESGSKFDRGAFKTPSLRNLKLSAPYFHNGGAASVHDVIDFYERHGTFDNPEKSAQMSRIELLSDDHAALEDFLLNGLLDCRVAVNSAPFDHPSLPVPNGSSLGAVGAAGQGSCP
jgi:cytochrome c peroxidase